MSKVIIEEYHGTRDAPSRVFELEPGQEFEAGDSYYWFIIREIKE